LVFIGLGRIQSYEKTQEFIKKVKKNLACLITAGRLYLKLLKTKNLNNKAYVFLYVARNDWLLLMTCKENIYEKVFL